MYIILYITISIPTHDVTWVDAGLYIEKKTKNICVPICISWSVGRIFCTRMQCVAGTVQLLYGAVALYASGVTTANLVEISVYVVVAQSAFEFYLRYYSLSGNIDVIPDIYNCVFG